MTYKRYVLVAVTFREDMAKRHETRCSPTSIRYVFSIRAFTTRADRMSILLCSSHVITGVLMFLDALMISLIRGTPCVILMPATPAKWNVFRVICVPGSPID